ncbi:MAG: cation diffusion facilitator family transporter [Planctomycetota bacterium]
MAQSDSKTAVTLAVAGNAFLAVMKGLAFFFSGSGAMLSEAIHSVADTGNQALLYVGIRRSERPANALFHYGFGAERFFFALMSAVGIFVLGCGVTLYHGVHLLLHPVVPQVGWLDFAVLGLGLLVDGAVLGKAVMVVRNQKGQTPFFRYLKESTDPTLAAVLLEDGVACFGILVALAGIGAAQATGSSIPDAVATLTIAMLMGAIAFWLGYKNRSLILGSALPPEQHKEVVDFLRAQPSVSKVSRAKSRIVGAGRFRFTAEIDWNADVLADRQQEWVEGHWPAEAADRRRFTQQFAERLTQSIADEVDRLEGELRVAFPQLQHLDLEDD